MLTYICVTSIELQAHRDAFIQNKGKYTAHVRTKIQFHSAILYAVSTSFYRGQLIPTKTSLSRSSQHAFILQPSGESYKLGNQHLRRNSLRLGCIITLYRLSFICLRCFNGPAQISPGSSSLGTSF